MNEHFTLSDALNSVQDIHVWEFKVYRSSPTKFPHISGLTLQKFTLRCTWFKNGQKFPCNCTSQVIPHWGNSTQSKSSFAGFPWHSIKENSNLPKVGESCLGWRRLGKGQEREMSWGMEVAREFCSQRGKGTGGAETEIRIKILITGHWSKNNSHTWQGGLSILSH